MRIYWSAKDLPGCSKLPARESRRICRQYGLQSLRTLRFGLVFVVSYLLVLLVGAVVLSFTTGTMLTWIVVGGVMGGLWVLVMDQFQMAWIARALCQKMSDVTANKRDLPNTR
jgi:hypothetical protein